MTENNFSGNTVLADKFIPDYIINSGPPFFLIPKYARIRLRAGRHTPDCGSGGKRTHILLTKMSRFKQNCLELRGTRVP